MKLSWSLFSLLIVKANAAEHHLRREDDLILLPKQEQSSSDIVLKTDGPGISGVIGLGASFRSITAQSGSCVDPIAIGELRNWQDKSQCIDPSGHDGRGNVGTYHCEGSSDQQFKFCEDGTIRSMASAYCLDVDGSDGRGNVQMVQCEIYPHVSPDQQWNLENIRSDNSMGIVQNLFRIRNRQSGWCLDISGNDGSGEVKTYSCQNYDDQSFYIPSRGGVVNHGKLQNQQSRKCMDVSGYDGLGNIATYTCEDELDQVFTLYENGEMVNSRSHQCVDIANSAGHGNIGIYPCLSMADQQWSQIMQNGEYFSLASVKANQCIDVSGSDGNGEIATYQCTGEPDQKWKWANEDWTTAMGSWNLIHCNESGGVTWQVSESTTWGSSNTISETTTVEVGSTISAGVKMASAEVSSSVSQSLGLDWTHSQSGTHTDQLTAACEFNEDGSVFTGGCMWQFHLESSSGYNELAWTSSNTRCTANHNAPKCPPFSRCADDGCTLCVPKA